TVRAVNWMRPPAQRLRVLLGQPPVTMDQLIAHPHDRALVQAAVTSTSLEEHYAAVVEQEVLHKGRRALLIAGGGHLLRGLHTEDDRLQLNAASRLAQRHPGTLYVVDTIILPPGTQQGAVAGRVQA